MYIERLWRKRTFMYISMIILWNFFSWLFIKQLYNFFEDANYVYLVLEICHNGELQRYLRSQARPLTEEEARRLMRQIVEGILYLHSHGIVHRDLTLSNLLLTKDMNGVSFKMRVNSCLSSFINVYIIHWRCLKSLYQRTQNFEWGVTEWVFCNLGKTWSICEVAWEYQSEIRVLLSYASIKSVNLVFSDF